METLIYKNINCEVLRHAKNPKIILLQGQKANGDGFQQFVTPEQLSEIPAKKKATDNIWELKWSKSKAILKSGNWKLCDFEREKLLKLPQYQKGELLITKKA